MSITQVGKQLWTPDGEVPLRQKDVVPIDRNELITLSRMHEFAAKHRIKMLCERCDGLIHGQNTGHEAQPAVECKCRQFRYPGA